MQIDCIYMVCKLHLCPCPSFYVINHFPATTQMTYIYCICNYHNSYIWAKDALQLPQYCIFVMLKQYWCKTQSNYAKWSDHVAHKTHTFTNVVRNSVNLKETTSKAYISHIKQTISSKNIWWQIFTTFNIVFNVFWWSFMWKSRKEVAHWYQIMFDSRCK